MRAEESGEQVQLLTSVRQENKQTKNNKKSE